MKQAVFSGAATALITPMYPDGSVNLEEMKRLVEWQIEQGIDALVACGTTGSVQPSAGKSICRWYPAWWSRRLGGFRLLQAAGSNDTAFSVVTSKEAAAIGADALMSATPYYNKTTQEGLFAPLLYDCRSGRTAVNRLQRPVSDGYGYLGGNLPETIGTSSDCGNKRGKRRRGKGFSHCRVLR